MSKHVFPKNVEVLVLCNKLANISDDKTALINSHHCLNSMHFNNSYQSEANCTPRSPVAANALMLKLEEKKNLNLA